MRANDDADPAAIAFFNVKFKRYNIREVGKSNHDKNKVTINVIKPRAAAAICTGKAVFISF